MYNVFNTPIIIIKHACLTTINIVEYYMMYNIQYTYYYYETRMSNNYQYH